MQLSEAIRLGAMLTQRQAFGVLEERVTYPPTPTLGLERSYRATCAIGGAMEAVGLACRWQSWFSFYGAFPAAPQALTATCPACGEKPDGGTIQHLNNDHRWSREQIADWVQTIEEQETAATQDALSADAVAGNQQVTSVCTVRA